MSLNRINEKLWDIENEKRLLEKNSDFGDKFVQVSRDVHFMNDKRAKLKKRSIDHLGLILKRLKSILNTKNDLYLMKKQNSIYSQNLE